MSTRCDCSSPTARTQPWDGEAYRDTITVVVEEGAAAPSVRFAEPADGATVSSSFEVAMEATGLVVEPSR